MTEAEQAARAALKAAGFSGPPLGSIYRRKARVVQEEMVVLYHGFVNLDVTADYHQLPALLAALDAKPADNIKQALDLCEQAIGLFLELRDQHGWDEEAAKPRALAEIREGLNALPAIAEMEAAKRVCPECKGEGWRYGPPPIGTPNCNPLASSHTCPTCYGTGKVDPPTDAQRLTAVALWMLHLSDAYLPEGGNAAAQTSQMSADLRAMAARLEFAPKANLAPPATDCEGRHKIDA